MFNTKYCKLLNIEEITASTRCIITSAKNQGVIPCMKLSESLPKTLNIQSTGCSNIKK